MQTLPFYWNESWLVIYFLLKQNWSWSSWKEDMTKFFDSFRSTFARTQLYLHVLALGFHAVNDVLDPVLQKFYSSSSSHSSLVLKVPITFHLTAENCILQIQCKNQVRVVCLTRHPVPTSHILESPRVLMSHVLAPPRPWVPMSLHPRIPESPRPRVPMSPRPRVPHPESHVPRPSP